MIYDRQYLLTYRLISYNHENLRITRMKIASKVGKKVAWTHLYCDIFVIMLVQKFVQLHHYCHSYVTG